MRYFRAAAVAAMIACVGQPAMAGSKFVLQPIPVGTEQVRFNQGVPTLDLEQPDGAVQVTPLLMDHGSLAFSVAVFNNGKVPANIDITNFDISTGPEKLAVFSREQLEGKAKKRAMWASIAVAAAGGIAAAAAASQRDHYTATTYTPRGTYRTVVSAPSSAGQAQAAIAAAGAGAGVYAIQSQLDRTREMLGDTTVQLTTVDPGDSYAGRIVLQKIKSKALPQRISFVVNWNGRAYPFAFQMVKSGTPQPAFKTLAPKPFEPDVKPVGQQTIPEAPPKTTV